MKDRIKIDNVIASLAIYLFNIVIFAWTAINLLVPSFRYYFDMIGIPRIDTAFWDNFHPAINVLFVLLAQDFANYWNHRAMHLRLIWPIHAIHHSDEDVNGATTLRIHALEAVFMQASYVVLISWLGLPVIESMIIGLMTTMHNAYVHLDLDWNHGPLKSIIASPRFHRWHHADIPEAHGKNLANIFPFYDILFGTYYNPGPCKAPMGARDMGVSSTDIVALMVYPIMAWGRMILKTLAAWSSQIRPDDCPPGNRIVSEFKAPSSNAASVNLRHSSGSFTFEG